MYNDFDAYHDIISRSIEPKRGADIGVLMEVRQEENSASSAELKKCICKGTF